MLVMLVCISLKEQSSDTFLFHLLGNKNPIYVKPILSIDIRTCWKTDLTVILSHADRSENDNLVGKRAPASAHPTRRHKPIRQWSVKGPILVTQPRGDAENKENSNKSHLHPAICRLLQTREERLCVEHARLKCGRLGVQILDRSNLMKYCTWFTLSNLRKYWCCLGAK